MPTNSSTTQDPATGIAALINAAATLDPVFHVAVGGFVDVPDTMVIVRNTGGRAEMAVSVDYPVIQLLVRDQNYARGYKGAIACRDAILGIPSNPSAYIELVSVVERGHIQELGRDDKDRMRWSLNLQLIVSYDVSGYRDWH